MLTLLHCLSEEISTLEYILRYYALLCTYEVIPVLVVFTCLGVNPIVLSLYIQIIIYSSIEASVLLFLTQIYINLV